MGYIYIFSFSSLELIFTAIFYLMTHAFFKSLLFLSVCSVCEYKHEQNTFKMAGLHKTLPFIYNFFKNSVALSAILVVSANFYS
ncbi:MAG: proton-conducting transporter membrane subunit [Arsenophonus sp.]